MRILIYNQTGVKLLYNPEYGIKDGESREFSERFFERGLSSSLHLHREDGKGSIIISDTRDGRKYKSFGAIFYTIGPEICSGGDFSLDNLGIHLFSSQSAARRAKEEERAAKEKARNVSGVRIVFHFGKKDK